MGLPTFLSSILITIAVHPNVYLECTSRLFNPLNYLSQLPSLSLPYVNKIPIPHLPAGMIKPTPVATTKVISVITTFVVQNPVCIHSTGKKKPPCKVHISLNQQHSDEQIVTKARTAKIKADREAEGLNSLDQELGKVRNSTLIPLIESSEEGEGGQNQRWTKSRNVRSVDGETPRLAMAEELKDLLIEDRLDKLEDVLPHYTRLRAYQTSTITVTRTRMNRMTTATLMVKNCVPDGIDFCKKRANASKGQKQKKRKSKVAIEQSPTLPHYSPYYYGK